MQILSINYLLNFGSVKIHKHCYIGKYLVLAYTERLSSTVCCFFSYIFWSANCMSWIKKFHLFWHAQKLRQDLYLRALIVHFQLSSNFLTFFIWSVNCSRDFSATFSVSKLYELSFELWKIFRRCPEA